MDFSNSPFVKITNVSRESQIVFVADAFADEYVGGAELTTEALIASSPFRVHRLRSREVTLEHLKEGKDKFWVFCNFSQLNSNLIPSIVGNLKYSILEYDYKYCKFRSSERHQAETGRPCDCHDQLNGKIVSAFFYGSMGIWWMSEKQREKYITLFPFLAERDALVLSSVFDDKTLGLLKQLSLQSHERERRGWIVLGSGSWIKGFEAAKKWCEDNKKEYEVVWNVPYEKLLEKLSRAEGLCYLPLGADTCPRLVIEAKLLGCQLQINENVQHRDEDWFATDDLEQIEQYLYAARGTFWNGIKKMIDYRPTISGYTTTYDCVSQEYPFEDCIRSLLGLCDEVCVVDGGSSDGTLEKLEVLQDEFTFVPGLRTATVGEKLATRNFVSRLKVKVVKRDWDHPRSAVFDGMQKAEARAMCTKEFCVQLDADEVIREDDYEKFRKLCNGFTKDVDIVSLPVIEYWGSRDKVRVDVTPWKWRLTRNRTYITHGIPVAHRRWDENGELYSAASDGCDLIHSATGEPLPHLCFFTPEVDNVRKMALLGNKEALVQYELWFNAAVTQLPSVTHFSWLDIERKIKLYKRFWSRHWRVLFGDDYVDDAVNNMFFDIPWSQVTDEMIRTKARELESCGGHVFHTKYKGQKTPWIRVNR